MKLYRTRDAFLAGDDSGRLYRIDATSWDALLNRPDLHDFLARQVETGSPQPGIDTEAIPGLEPPIGSQEVWGAGVTYFRSREARIEESEQAGGGDFYARVYDAERPELFFKASPHRVVGHGQPVRIRGDARWSIPEPELTLVVNSGGAIVGYTIGNDMSARDIEGENPLYLPQAKTWDGCCALGPGILVSEAPLPAATPIRLEVHRDGSVAAQGETSLERMKRRPEDLVSFLTRECSFPAGCFLLTGTGVVPDADFALRAGDEIRISIGGIGTLVNRVG